MKQLRAYLAFLLVGVLVASCSASRDTVGGGLIQKRKYTKGFYLNRHSGGKSDEARTKRTLQREKAGVVSGEVISESNDAAALVRQNAVISAVPVSETPHSSAAAPGHVFRHTATSSAAVPTISGAGEKNTQPEIQQEKKPVRQVMQLKKKAGSSGDIKLVILVILALIIPPLAVGLFEGITARFWLTLVLFLIGIGVGWMFGLAWACAVAAVVYALLIVLGVI